MLRDPQEEHLEGFGKWEYLNLLGVTFTKAHEVHSAFIDEWNFVNRTNPNYRRPRRAERARVLWRTYQRDRTTSLTLHRQSGITSEPMPPLVHELDDLEDFIFDMQGRFRLVLRGGSRACSRKR